MKRRYKTLAGLLAKPERWCKNAMRRIDFETGEVVACCLWGGANDVRIDPLGNMPLLAKAIAQEFPETRWPSVPEFNDASTTTHADILRVARRFDKLVKARSAK